jgi:hypothetical protein
MDSEESRTDRLLRLAEAAAVEGEMERTFALLGVLAAVDEFTRREVKSLKKMAKKATVDHE